MFTTLLSAYLFLAFPARQPYVQHLTNVQAAVHRHRKLLKFVESVPLGLRENGWVLEH